MYCRGCKYDLRVLGAIRQCPECGHEFDPADPSTTLDALPRPLSIRARVMRIVAILVVGALLALVIQFMAAAQTSGH